MKNESSNVCGVVLVGGKSRRMGWDKASMSLGKTRVLMRLIGELEGICGEIVLAGKGSEFTSVLKSHAPVCAIPDAVPSRGPLGGVVSAMRASQKSSFLIIPCDMPFLGTAVFRKFISLAGFHEVVIGPDRGFPVLLSRDVLPHLEKALSKEDLCFFDVIENVPFRVWHFSAEDFKDLGDPVVTFFNVNTPSDFELAEKLFRITWR